MALAAGYVLTGRLGLAVDFHAGWNLAMGVVFGQPVSGLSVPARLLVVDVTGPAAWTGGAFGSEAGLSGVFAALGGLAGVVAYARLVAGAIRVHPDLLVPDLRTDGDRTATRAVITNSPTPRTTITASRTVPAIHA